MNTLVSLELYYPLFINLCLFLVLFTLLHTKLIEIDDRKNLIFINTVGYVLLFLLILHLGLRPIHRYFGDTVNYNVSYTNYQNGAEISDVNDLGWHMFMKFMSQIVSVHIFLTICAIIYIFPLYKLSKTLFKEYWWYSFLLFVVSFSFWAYGANGVRNGAACSLFLWGVCYRKRPVIMILLFFISVNFHKTTFLPILAYAVTYLYNNPKFYFKTWLACIPISLILGSVFITLFSMLGFGGDDRLSGYLTTGVGTSFRWDFIFHSSFPIFAGWYFVIKRNFNDNFYNQLLNTYLICNSFWILIIKANFSNRFAYLSWFMMAIIIIYPLLKQKFFENQHLIIGRIVLVYFSFTYFMYYVYK